MKVAVRCSAIASSVAVDAIGGAPSGVGADGGGCTSSLSLLLFVRVYVSKLTAFPSISLTDMSVAFVRGVDVLWAYLFGPQWSLSSCKGIWILTFSD